MEQWSNYCYSYQSAPGTYTVTVKDDNNCSSSAGPVSITEPAVLTTSMGAPTMVGCNGVSDGSVL